VIQDQDHFDRGFDASFRPEPANADMSTQLDILALEPFFGGARRAMLETVMRYSRHRWTLLKLPPRRIERRLAAAAHWFAEQLLRHWVGRVDVIFTSEAMNLQDLVRQVPELRSKPSVVYFHENQLPPVGRKAENALQLVNLSTTNCATEVWFNSTYHMKQFVQRASSLVERHPELSGRNPLPDLAAKTQVMPPPVDFALTRDAVYTDPVKRDPRLLFVDTRDAQVDVLNEALMRLTRRAEKFKLITVGPVEGLDDELPRRTISERDEKAQIRALHEAAVLISARPGAASDHHAVRGLHLGCWPIFPNSGVYPELLPKSLHSLCLYDGAQADRLVNQLQNIWWVEQPAGYQKDLENILSQFEAMTACQAMDERLEHLAVAHSIR
jgi:hypothetical protein